ncbi:metal ABC transporter ATP-binding protein [Pelotomaculum terephthalicicum JT]|uniref:metal ABC transporter ATP-binding protein n=1 Tax=Pelotomaculum TaxID=191373 RepID=UPI0009CBCD2F|nr:MULTISPECIES: metal ABC transporter ATP-binding protein [Pelotomaculum]MCG9969462.1 metal ABC transporter ATP-binding protein [Pelotomaculum terephthalicicum JT]OPX89348.1 MAG: Zinc import ATP-binding protein ZnuC [Pelotomaculum sp. PtaB.Bin117]
MSKVSIIQKTHRESCGLCHTKLKNFGVTIGRTEILRDIDLHIQCGELTALVGPNGAGKTTLLKAILGEIRHTGELSFLDAGDCRRNPVVGYVPQRLDFDPGSPVSVLDLFSACLSSWPVCLVHSRRRRERVSAGLASVQAEHLLDRRLGDLSGGELQRVLLAMALEPNPDLLLLDEPVSGIDVQGKEIFYDLVSNLRKQYDLSIILVSHDWSLVSNHADRIVLLDRTVQRCGTPQEVFSDERILRTYGPAISKDTEQTFLKPRLIHNGGVRA